MDKLKAAKQGKGKGKGEGKGKGKGKGNEFDETGESAR
jgi:hypothetical protein